MSISTHQDRVERKRKLRNRQRRIRYRLRPRAWASSEQPMFQAGNIHYDVADKTRGLGCGGIALGLDRIVMLITGTDNIRDVIAFPKNAKAFCPLTNAPSEVSPEQLRELEIQIRE